MFILLLFRLFWILLLFDGSSCYPNIGYDYNAQADRSNLQYDSQPRYETSPSYLPAFTRTYESDPDPDEDDARWNWKENAYVNPEKNPNVPAKPQREPNTGSSEGYEAWYEPSATSVYAVGSYDGSYEGATDYARVGGPDVYSAGGGTSGYYVDAGSVGGPDHSSLSHSDTSGDLLALRGTLMAARPLPMEAWNDRHVPQPLIAEPPVRPSSLVVQTHGAYKRARDFRSDMKYNQNTFDYIPLSEMQKGAFSERNKF